MTGHIEKPEDTFLEDVPRSAMHADDKHGGASTPSEKGNEAQIPVAWTAEEEKRVKRLIDYRMVPMLVITFALTYYDKSVLGMAIIFTMKKDTHLVGNEYSYISFIFYVGYLLGSFPMSYIAQKFHIGRSVAIMTLLWGFTTLCTIWCTTFTHLMIQRTFLGFIEAGIAPTFIAISGAWYTRREQVLRVALFYAATPSSNIWAAPITYALGQPQNGPFGHMTWKYMFLFAGLLTCCWAFVVLWVFPTSPQKASFLNEHQREIAIARLKVGNTGTINHTIKISQIREALTDLNFWAICVMGWAVTVTGGTTTSFSFVVVKGFGFNNLQSLLFKMPWGFLASVNMLLGAYIAGRYPNKRFYVYQVGCVPVIIGSALLWASPSTGNPKVCGLVGYYMLTTFGMAYAQVMAMAGANFAGYTKKVTASAGLFVSYGVANIAALLAFQEKQAPGYAGGFECVVISCAVGLVVSIFLRMRLARLNRQRDSEAAPEHDHGLDDLTDKENRSFRYTL